MTATITPLLTMIYDAETNTGWNLGNLYSGFQRQGSYCLGEQVSQGTGHFYYTLSSPIDLTNTKIYSWMQVWGNPDTKANGGFRIVLGDGTNRVAYYVGGSDDYGLRYGAWSCFSMSTVNGYRPNYTILAGTGEPDFSAITEVGVGFNVLNKAIGNIDNVFWDVAWYGTGLKISGGDSTTPATFKDLADADESSSNAWGIIIEDKPNVYHVQGQIIVGDETGTNNTYFQDKEKTILFLDRGFEPSFYKIEVRGASGTTTYFYLGEKSGSSGIRGVSLIGLGNSAPVFDAYTYTSTIDGLGIYGSTFRGFGTISLPDTATGVEVISTSFISSDLVYAYQCPITNSFFISAPNRALWIPTNHNVSNCQFIANNVATYLTTAGDYTYDALTFSANTYDIENATSGTINVYATNGSNPSTVLNSGGGTTNIINSVYVTVKVVDTANNPIQNARVFVENIDDNVVIMNQLTDSTGTAQTTYNYPGVDKNLLVNVRKSTPGETRYIPAQTFGVLTSTGFSTTVVLFEDSVSL